VIRTPSPRLSRSPEHPVAESKPGHFVEPIRSLRNERIAEALRLRRSRGRAKTGRTLIEGPNVLADAIGGGANVERVFGLPDDAEGRGLAERAGAEWIPVVADVLDRLAPSEHPKGPVSVAVVPHGVIGDRDVVWFDLADPGNAGTLVRTAAALGFDVASPTGAADLWAPKVIRAGAGGHFQTSVVQPADLSEISGFKIVAVPRGGRRSEALRDLDISTRCIAIIGSESHGLDSQIVDSADLAVTIQMSGTVESLNAAVSGAIVMYELALRRHETHT